MAVLVGTAALSEIGITDLSSTALSGLGKDKTLTGRTELWKGALEQIDDEPFTGDGFGAFWRPGNPKAEVLWAEFGDLRQRWLSVPRDLSSDLGRFGIHGCRRLIGHCTAER